MQQLLSDAIDDFERFRRSQNVKKSTMNGQRAVLRRFLTANGNILTHKIGSQHITRHFEEAARTRQPQTLRIDHVALSVFFDWCRHTKRMGMDNDPLYGRRIPKGVKKERNRLNVTEFPALLDAAGERCARDRAVIAVILYTLLRDQEAADLRLSDVDLDGGWLRARIHKTNAEDRIPICEELDRELRVWLTTYAAEVGPLKPNYRLLPARWVTFNKGEDGRYQQGRHVSELRPDRDIGPLGRIVNPVLGSIGFPITDPDGKPCGEGAHTIRRSGARALFDSLVAGGYDGSLRVVQSLLHHSSVTTTELYLGITADRRTRDDLLKGRRMYATPTKTGTLSVVESG